MPPTLPPPRVISLQAVDVEQGLGPVSQAMISFDRTCSVWPDTVLTVPQDFTTYGIPLDRLGLCTAIEIPRLEIVDSSDITSLYFMENVTVSYCCSQFWSDSEQLLQCSG